MIHRCQLCGHTIAPHEPIVPLRDGGRVHIACADLVAARGWRARQWRGCASGRPGQCRRCRPVQQGRNALADTPVCRHLAGVPRPPAPTLVGLLRARSQAQVQAVDGTTHLIARGLAWHGTVGSGEEWHDAVGLDRAWHGASAREQWVQCVHAALIVPSRQQRKESGWTLGNTSTRTKGYR